jgi:hypothetical protein
LNNKLDKAFDLLGKVVKMLDQQNDQLLLVHGGKKQPHNTLKWSDNIDKESSGKNGFELMMNASK